MKRMFKQWMAGLLSVALVFALLPATARAEEPSEYDVSAATVEITGDGSYTVTGATSDNTIIVTGGTVTLTLNSVSVHSGAGTPLDIQGGDVTLILPAGTKSTFETDPGSGKAGIHVAEDASLTIEGPGALDATGSSNGAGIGGDFTSNAGSITINGGTITAKSTADGAGIGGGHANESQGRIYGQFRSITITGGTVTAESWSNGAGIGCGCWAGAMGPITISGGEVHASTFANSGQACDIGYAHRATDFESTVTVSGGVVYTEGTHGRGIVAKNVDLNNCLIVTRFGDYNFYGDLTFSSDFTLAAGKELPIPGGHALRVSEGAVFTNLGTICINPGGSLDVQGSLDNTSGTITNFSGTVTGGDKITGNPPIELGDVTYLDWDDSAKKLVQRTLHGPYNMVNSYTTDWDSGWYVLTDNVTMPSSIKVNAYNVHLILMDGCTLTTPGIYLENRSDLTIYAQSTGNNMGAISSTAVETYAGIGGRENGYTITINGGKITATGSQGGAGIGGEYGASMGTAVINSGIVTATGGRDEALEAGGAGIGAGFNGRLGGTVTINGGIVIATGCEYSPGIGGAGTNASWQKPADGGNITITGGTVTATGGGGAPGIGGGQYTRDDSLGGSGTFSTGPDGNAVIYASSIQDQSSKSGWSGVIFENNVGQVYGNPIPTEDFEVKDGASLTVPEDATLTVSNGITMTNNGTVINNGHVYKTSGGIITGNPFLPTSEEIPFLGSGTTDSPYLIPDKATLEAFRDYINAGNGAGEYFKLTNNIDLDGTASNQWKPIGDRNHYFQGTFDGNDCEISELYVTPQSAGYDSGLFAFIGDSGTVENLSVSGYVKGNTFVGGVAASNEGTIRNCDFDGEVAWEQGPANAYVGGIVGSNDDGTINNCRNSASVSSGSTDVGGIVGENSGSVINCSNSGNITGTGTNTYTGGIVGSNYYGTIANCYNTGNIGGTGNYPGGIVGSNSRGTVTNCYNTGSIGGTGNYPGGIVGSNSRGTVTNCYFLYGRASSGFGSGNGDAIEKSSDQFASGEVAWLLQNDQDEQVWGQTVGDGYPELTDSAEKTVYKVTFATSAQPEYAAKYANHNGTVELPDNPTLDGTVFDHWSTVDSASGGSKFDNTTQVTGDVTVHAVGRNTFGGESDAIALITTYGTALTEDLSEHMAYQLGAETAGKFAYEITAGNDALNATIEGDILTIPATANAESYTLTIVATEKAPAYSLMSVASYGTADVTLTVTVTIAKADPEVTAPTAKELTYTGAAQALVEAGSATGGAMLYALGDATQATADYSDAIPEGTDAGTYYVWYYVAGDANHNDAAPQSVTVTIAQAAATVTAPTAKMPLTYNGAAQELITEGNVTSDVPGCGTMRYSLSEGSGFTADLPTGTDAKAYTVYWKVDGADETNYKYSGDISGQVTVTIAPAQAVVTTPPTPVTATYTGEEIALVSGGEANFGTLVYSLTEAGPFTATVTAVNAGTYTVYYKVEGTDNWNASEVGSVQAAIEKAASSTTAPTAQALTYTGEAQALVTAGSTADGAMVYALGTSATDAPTEGYEPTVPTAANAGTYYVWWKVQGDVDHTDTAPACVTVTIAPAALSFEPVAVQTPYTGAAIFVTVAQTAGQTPAVDPEKLAVSYEQNGAAVEPVLPGTYDVLVAVTDPNFVLADGAERVKVGTLTITHVHVYVEEWVHDETNHWHVCQGVGACDAPQSGLAAHQLTWVDDGDGTGHQACAVCGYTTGTHTHASDAWHVDEANGRHYKTCDACGAEFDRAAHQLTWVDDGDGTGHQTCTVCGAVTGAHTHVWDDGVVTLEPTTEAEGSRLYTCSVCGATKSEAISKLNTFQSSGVVTDHAGNPLAGVAVRLTQGHDTVAEAVTDDQGRYSFSSVPAGLYNVAATWEEVTKTILVEITDADAHQRDIQMPNGKVSSVVEVLGEDTPDVVVGGVDAVAEAEAASPDEVVTVTLTVAKEEEPASKEEINKLVTGKKDDVFYLDLSLLKQVNAQPTQAITDTGARVLEIVVPYDFSAKRSVTVYRKHGDDPAAALTALSAQPDLAEAEDGTFLADRENGRIAIYASKFSTYAIAYQAEAASTSGGSGVIPYVLTATAGEGGTIDPAGAIRVRRGDSQSYAIRPEAGYEVADVLVDGASVGAVTAYTFENVAAAHTIQAVFQKTGADGLPFTDVASGDWFYGSVKDVYQRGLMQGVAATTFAPGQSTTRAMVVTILYRLEGEPGAPRNIAFADVAPGLWYTDAISWAAANGIVEGYSQDAFGPEDLVTREQLVTILYRYAAYKGADVSGQADLTSYADASTINAWASDAMAWAVQSGLIQGRSATTLVPAGTSTRAELAAVLARYCGTAAAKGTSEE